jgi:hypothetical protein
MEMERVRVRLRWSVLAGRLSPLVQLHRGNRPGTHLEG